MVKPPFTLKLFSFLFLLIGLVACNEDTIEPRGEGSISGTVVSSETGEAVTAVSIATTPATTAILTNTEGKFLLESIADGDYSITAKKSGYKTETVNVAVKDGKQTAVTIVLEKSKEGSTAPNPATNPEPATNSENLSASVTLKWKGSDPDKGDTLTYDVYLFESGAVQKKRVAEAIKDTSIVVSDLKYNTTYYWQVVTKDAKTNVTNGEVWSFRTAALPDLRYLFAREVDGNYDIYSSNGAEALTLKLTDGFAREWWPRMNPKRDVIAYSSNASIEPQIFTMNRDGSNKRQVTTLPVVGYHNQGMGFTWSPDGGKILYAHYDKLYTINRDGSGLTLIATAPANRHFRMVDWTSQGNKIVVQTMGSNINESELYLMDADGSDMTLLIGNLPGRVESPSFSLDGKRILYTVDASGNEAADGRQLDSRIYIRNIDGSGTAVDISVHKPAGTNDLDPRFSPDGSKVIFVNASNDGFGPRDIWTVELTDTKIRTKAFSNAVMPDWK